MESHERQKLLWISTGAVTGVLVTLATVWSDLHRAHPAPPPVCGDAGVSAPPNDPGDAPDAGPPPVVGGAPDGGPSCGTHPWCAQTKDCCPPGTNCCA